MTNSPSLSLSISQFPDAHLPKRIVQDSRAKNGRKNGEINRQKKNIYSEDENEQQQGEWMQWIQNRNPTNKFLVGELYCSFAINCFALFSVCCKWFRSAIPFSGELHSHCSDECAVDWMSMRVIENAKCSQYIYCLAFWIEWTAKCNETRAHELTQKRKKNAHTI